MIDPSHPYPTLLLNPPLYTPHPLPLPSHTSTSTHTPSITTTIAITIAIAIAKTHQPLDCISHAVIYSIRTAASSAECEWEAADVDDADKQPGREPKTEFP